ncbi:MAG TPA: hypothetical protein VIH87_02780 [Methylocella sp.]
MEREADLLVSAVSLSCYNSLMAKQIDDRFNEEETVRRRDAALLRALNTPPKRHSEMKIGKCKAKREPSKPSPRRASQEKGEEPSDRP